MAINFAHLPRSVVIVDAQNVSGPFEGWRHSIGHGGVNHLPLPDRIVVGAQKLKPRRARIDEGCRWLEEDMELLPYVQRRVDVLSAIEYQFFSPADSVLWVTLEDYS